MQTSEATSEAQPTTRNARIVLRNTVYLGVAEVLTVPISIVLNGVMGRYLGPEDMGHLYLAITITKLAFLAVEWGHHGSLPAAVVRDKEHAGSYLGSTLAWRLVSALLTYCLVALGCKLAGFSEAQQWAVGLAFFAATITSAVTACQEVVRGFERTDVAAYSRVGTQLASVFLVIPVLLLGGKLSLTLLAIAVSAFLVLLAVMRTLGPIGVGAIRWDRQRFKALMVGGTPFVFFGLALVLQPNVDAFYLARLTSPEVVGWYGVSHKLVGFLVVPATALIGALYPTLCRLYTTDQEGFRQTTRGAIRSVNLLVVPVALGCALFPDIGVSIFGREAFLPAEDVLRLFSVHLFLVYFTMPIGTALVAAGRQRAWTLLQLFCVVNSVILDPILIHYFQTNHGNGGLGLPIASATSELVMLGAGIALTPKGIFDRSLAKSLALALLSGLAMAGAALATRGLPSVLGAALAGLTYALALHVTGAISLEQKAALTRLVQHKLLRRNARSAG